jgi:hypothetical protein
MNAKSIARWSVTRQLGMSNFIYSRGILGFGTGFALLSLALEVWQGHTIEHKELLVRLGMQILLGGTLWGYAMWWWLERIYKRAIGANANPTHSQN